MLKHLKIGQILINQGVLSEQQVFEICEAQRETGTPFGVLAERMFDVTIQSIEGAWIEQYHQQTGTLDLAGVQIDSRALELIDRRQAWQFQMMPVCFEPTGEVVVAASRERLARTVTFSAKQFKQEVYLRVAEPTQLRAYLQKHYAMPEVPEEMLQRARQMAYNL